MAHYTRVRTFGGWAALTTLTATEMEKFDSQAFGAINGDAGGSWAPSAEITLTGTFGLRSTTFKAGPNISGNPAFEVDPITGDILHKGISRFTGNSIFTGAVTLNGISLFNADATFTDDAIFNGNADFNAIVEIPSSPTGTTVRSVSAQPYFEVFPSVAFTDKHVHWRPVAPDPSNPLLWKEECLVTGGQRLVAGNAGADAYIQLFLDPNCSYSSFSVRVDGATHGTFPPTNRTAFVLQEVDTVARTTTNISNTEIDTTAQVTYESPHALVLTGMVAFRPVPGKQYYIFCKNESGTNSVSGYILNAVVASGSINRFGTHMYNPILKCLLLNIN